jgi:hypothetical protein
VDIRSTSDNCQDQQEAAAAAAATAAAEAAAAAKEAGKRDPLGQEYEDTYIAAAVLIVVLV